MEVHTYLVGGLASQLACMEVAHPHTQGDYICTLGVHTCILGSCACWLGVQAYLECQGGGLREGHASCGIKEGMGSHVYHGA